MGPTSKILLWVAVAVIVPSALSQDPHKGHYKGDEHNAQFDHEAFLGKEEAEAYSQLTPEEAKERLEKMVPSIDRSGDGQVSLEEMIYHILFMQKKFVKNNVERAWEMFAQKLDNDMLKWADYRELVYAPHEKAGKDVPPEFTQAEDRDRNRWKAADSNKDDALDREEYKCFIHPETCPHMTDTVVQETLLFADHNKDGEIDVDEYISQWFRPEDYPDLQGKEPDWVEQERAVFREERDKDKDGKLNMQEMKDWIMPTGIDRATTEAKHLVEMADDNKDMALTKDEFLHHHELFVGSSATHYGEQLRKHDPAEL